MLFAPRRQAGLRLVDKCVKMYRPLRRAAQIEVSYRATEAVDEPTVAVQRHEQDLHGLRRQRHRRVHFVGCVCLLCTPRILFVFCLSRSRARDLWNA